jgi:WD40 repeat protein
VAVASSNLTGNLWKGELTVYADSSVAGEKKKASGKTPTEAGCPAAAWLTERRLLTGCDTGAVNIWEWRGDGGLECIGTFMEHDDVVRTLTVCGDKSKALTTSDDTTMRVWNVLDEESTASMCCLQGHAGPVLAGEW